MGSRSSAGSRSSMKSKRSSDSSEMFEGGSSQDLAEEDPYYDEVDEVDPDDPYNINKLEDIHNDSEIFDNQTFIVIKNIGVLVSKKARNGIDEMLLCHAEVLSRINTDDKLNYLSESEVGRLLDWEPEKYRQSIG